MSLSFLHPLITAVRSVPEAMQNTAVGWMSKVSEKLGKQAKEPKEVKARGVQNSSLPSMQAKN